MRVVPGWREMTEQEFVEALVNQNVYTVGAARYVARTLKKAQENAKTTENNS